MPPKKTTLQSPTPEKRASVRPADAEVAAGRGRLLYLPSKAPLAAPPAFARRLFGF
jgi:hypothetical protein